MYLYIRHFDDQWSPSIQMISLIGLSCGSNFNKNWYSWKINTIYLKILCKIYVLVSFLFLSIRKGPSEPRIKNIDALCFLEQVPPTKNIKDHDHWWLQKWKNKIVLIHHFQSSWNSGNNIIINQSDVFDFNICLVHDCRTNVLNMMQHIRTLYSLVAENNTIPRLEMLPERKLWKL